MLSDEVGRIHKDREHQTLFARPVPGADQFKKLAGHKHIRYRAIQRIYGRNLLGLKAYKEYSSGEGSASKSS